MRRFWQKWHQHVAGLRRLPRSELKILTGNRVLDAQAEKMGEATCEERG